MTPTEWRTTLRRDLAANRGYPKSAVVLVALRTAQLVRSRRGPVGRLAYLVVGTTYKLVSEWLLGVEIPASTVVGPGLRIRHGVGIVVNPKTVIGADVMLRHGVTLGNRGDNRSGEDDCPVIGDRVEFGANAAVVGHVTVGDDAKIGVGAVVVKDVPAGAVAVAPTATLREPRR